MAEPTKDNLDATNTQPSVPSVPPTPPVASPPVAANEESLPGNHPPTVALPTTSATPVKQVQPKPLKEEKGVKPKDVALPEKGKPEIFIEEKAEAGASKKKIEIPEVANDEGTKRDLKGVQPVLETGGVGKKRKLPILKIIKFIVFIVLALVLLGGVLVGVGILRDMLMSRKASETEVVVKVPEPTPVVEREKDLTDLDALEDAFDGIGGQLEVLEENTDFESKILSTRADF